MANPHNDLEQGSGDSGSNSFAPASSGNDGSSGIPGAAPKSGGGDRYPVNQGPYYVYNNQGTFTPGTGTYGNVGQGPAVPVPPGATVRVRNIGNSAGVQTACCVGRSREGGGYILQYDDEIPFPVQNLAQIFVSATANAGLAVGVEISIRSGGL